MVLQNTKRSMDIKMSIDKKVMNFKKAIKESKSKAFVYERFQEYLQEYDQIADKSIVQKLNHRNLFFDYFKYMKVRDKK